MSNSSTWKFNFVNVTFATDTDALGDALKAGPPIGTPAVAVVRIVPLESGRLMVRSVLPLGEAIVKVPVPLALGESEILDLGGSFQSGNIGLELNDHCLLFLDGCDEP